MVLRETLNILVRSASVSRVFGSMLPDSSSERSSSYAWPYRVAAVLVSLVTSPLLFSSTVIAYVS
jgi:hypothetical protein